jgi:hypothetical protein
MLYRKQFTRSDFSKTLRELGLTPSAVSLLDILFRENGPTPLQVLIAS